jgi:hypothetical protein
MTGPHDHDPTGPHTHHPIGPHDDSPLGPHDLDVHWDPASLDPLPPQPPPPAGETPSVTSWTRLETSCRDVDMQRSVSARIYDPLWMLTRQWQVGEFQGEDAGSPVIARTRAQTTLLSRAHLGVLTPDSRSEPYDSAQTPLEVLVERRQLHSGDALQPSQLRLAVDAGLHFLRMLEEQPVSPNCRNAFTATYPLAATAAGATSDSETARFVAMMAGRTVDARLLAEAFRTSDGSAPTLDARLNIDTGDRAEIILAAATWLKWYDGLFSNSEQNSEDAWIPERLEYAVSVAGRLSAQPTDEKTLTAAELYDGHLDWSDFDLNVGADLGTEGDAQFSSIVQTTIPAPVSFRGTPAARFWEFEDARVEYGLLPVGPADLGQLMMIEYTSSYGNDWFVVPLDVPVGSLTSINSLVVTDTFGVQTLLRPLGDPALSPPNWSMFQQSYLRTPGSDLRGVESNLFFLAPSVGKSLQSSPIEEVVFMRDEMANVAWAIERSIESPLGQSMSRTETAAVESDSAPDATSGDGAPPRYLLSSRVPSNWIPLLPVELPAPGGKVISRLQRGAVLLPDGSQQRQRALGRLLNVTDPLLLHDEEVPREGVRVTRHYQMTRWTDGATFVWLANKKQIGRGEGSSGLRFDTLIDNERTG